MSSPTHERFHQLYENMGTTFYQVNLLTCLSPRAARTVGLFSICNANRRFFAEAFWAWDMALGCFCCFCCTGRALISRVKLWFGKGVQSFVQINRIAKVRYGTTCIIGNSQYHYEQQSFAFTKVLSMLDI